MKSILFSVFIFALAAPSFAGGSKVFFKNLKDGQTIPQGKFIVEFGLKGMKVSPAGTDKKGTGHHHLLFNTGAIAKGEVIPSDTTHIHFGKGQTNTEINLAPGKHTLTLQFADGAHKSFGPEMSSSITITVQ